MSPIFLLRRGPIGLARKFKLFGRYKVKSYPRRDSVQHWVVVGWFCFRAHIHRIDRAGGLKGTTIKDGARSSTNP
ncbi:MAG TPA: hypothetical protein DDW52_21665 [Planctomycetaceae bacterium]|nr:hypothetical protein [Planctomycetaceae bacterium]